MIQIKIYCNMDDLKIENVNVKYGFTFKCNYNPKKLIVIVQIVHLTMFPPNPHCFYNKCWTILQYHKSLYIIRFN